MRYIILFLLLICSQNTFSQKLSFKNCVFIFKNIEARADTSLSEDNWYCYIDSDKFIHLSSEPFRINDEGYAYSDTVRVGDTSIVKAVMGFIPHRIINVFKYEKKGEEISMIRKKTPSSKRYPCFDTKYTSYKSNNTFFSDKNEKYANVITKLVNKDTIIKFNDLNFSCWKYEENYKHYQAIGHYYFFIDKKSLLPFGFEIEESIYDNIGKQNSKMKRYMLFGILQLNKAFTKGLHIWGEKSLE